jgi:pimeloyl-ACP methyl ester carboxylesterase
MMRRLASSTRAMPAVAALCVASWAAAVRAEEPRLPIVFVHGAAGSAAQYETQAMRFASNGYPNVVTGIDRTSSVSSTLNPQLDAFFDDVMEQTGDTQIYVIAHSLGTTLMNNYLNSAPARAARVAKYISIDGSPASCGAIPTVCTNITAAPLGQGHTQSVTSAESFVLQYTFLTGQAPATTLVVPEPPGLVQIAGKAINFPANTGANGATVELWEVHAATGHRKDTEPKAVFEIGPTGEFGPVKVNGQKSWEFALTRPETSTVVNYYFQPFIRSDSLVRLLVAAPDAGTTVNTATGPDHAAAVLIRYKEWWSDQATGNDTLWVTTDSPAWNDDPTNPSPPALNVLSHPGVGIRASNKIGLHIHDALADKVSTLAPIPFFVAQVFQTGADVWMPATTPADGTIGLTNEPRGDTTRPQTINVPNLASNAHRIVVQFNDYVQDINSWAECKAANPSPCK